MSATHPHTLSESSGLLHTARSQWMSFWFTPADALPLGLMRVLTGVMLTYNLCVWGLDLPAFFGAGGLQPTAAVESFYGSRSMLAFLHLVPDDQLAVVHWSCVAVAVLFTAGLLTRITSVLAFLITVSYSQRVPVANFGLDQLLGMLCLYLAVGPSGAALSLDSMLIRKWRTRRGLPAADHELPMARMSLRLIQLHVCIIYFWAGFAKLKGDTWWTGEAMWQVIANHEYQTTDLTWMAWVPWLPYLLAHVTVAWEVSFCAMVWKDRLRPIWLAIGTAVHVGIGACLGMWTFGLIMTFPYFAFSDGRRWRRRLTLFGESLQEKRSDDSDIQSDSAGDTQKQPAAEPHDPWAASEPYVSDGNSVEPVDPRPAYDIYADVTPDPVAESPAAAGTGETTVAENDSAEPIQPARLGTEQPVVAQSADDVPQVVVREKTAVDTPVQPMPSEDQNRQSSERAQQRTFEPPTVAKPRVVASPTPPATSEPETVLPAAGESLITDSGEDATQALFREMMGLSSAPVRQAPTAPKRSKWPSRRATVVVSRPVTENKTDKEARMKPKKFSQEVGSNSTMANNGGASDLNGGKTDNWDSSDQDLIIDDDFVINGVSGPAGPIVHDNCQTGLLDPADHPEGNLLMDDTEHSNANMPPDTENADTVISGEAMSPPPNPAEGQDLPDASHVLTTSKRMDRIRPKTANSLTGAPPPQVDGRVEDSVLAPETEVLLVAVHAPERNTFRTYLRRHDIPCRGAVSSENAVSVCLGMKPAAVLISGSMLNPEEILTLVDDLNDMIDAPILTLLTGAQVKLLSNDPMPAHILQYPASLRQIRAELMNILLEDGNARPRCSLRTTMASE